MSVPSTSIPQATPSSDDYFDLGSYSRVIRTKSPEASVWFNRGLLWCYGFNHEEAVRCFTQAVAHDDTCLMAYWGLAYALGPNYNKPWEFFDHEERETTVARTREVLVKAMGMMDGTEAVENKLISALRYRYSLDRPPSEDFSVWNRQYAEYMGTVYELFPSDLDVAALYADALMNLMPWQLWDIKTGQPTQGAPTMQVKAVLEKALELESGRQHPGLLHLYIHFMEMSPYPEKALPMADRLRGLVPDAGHLQHMPSHLDVLCGEYRRAIASNMDASRADEKFLAKRGGLNFYTLYRCHDYHFGVYAAMLAGQSEIALTFVQRLEATLPEDLLRVKSPPMADWLESFLSMRIHVLIRFGRWGDILAMQAPRDTALYSVTTAMLHYGKGVAHAATGNIPNAEEQHALFSASLKRVSESRTLFNNKCTDLLAIAAAMLQGELLYRKGDIDTAFQHLETAIERDDNLPYDEPWGWMQPVRHAYGALLLEQGRYETAVEVYKADLGMNDTLPRQLQHHSNVWALHGLHEGLMRLGREEEAGLLKPQLRFAVAMADVQITSSCFCRRDAD